MYFFLWFWVDFSMSLVAKLVLWLLDFVVNVVFGLILGVSLLDFVNCQ